MSNTDVFVERLYDVPIPVLLDEDAPVVMTSDGELPCDVGAPVGRGQVQWRRRGTEWWIRAYRHMFRVDQDAHHASPDDVLHRVYTYPEDHDGHAIIEWIGRDLQDLAFIAGELHVRVGQPRFIVTDAGLFKPVNVSLRTRAGPGRAFSMESLGDALAYADTLRAGRAIVDPGRAVVARLCFHPRPAHWASIIGPPMSD